MTKTNTFKIISTFLIIAFTINSSVQYVYPSQNYLRPLATGISEQSPQATSKNSRIGETCHSLELPLFATDTKPVAWERLVYNAGAVRIDGMTYVFYRALGEDGISRIGLWWSKDGICEEGRLDYPIFTPGAEYELPRDLEARQQEHLKNYGLIKETGGIEDPRLTIIGNRIYMLYTAYGNISQIAMASISIENFVNQRWSKWERHGLVFPGIINKDATLINFKGGLLLVHRLDGTNMYSIRFKNIHALLNWIDKAKLLKAEKINEYVRNNSRLLLKSPIEIDEKIGAGAQSLKTEYGWLNIYHVVKNIAGVKRYTLHVLLTDLNNPEKIIYRSSKPILVPEKSWEKEGWAPNVVFTCGAVPKHKDSNEILDGDDEILVYYGGADKVMAVAEAKISDLIPTLPSKEIEPIKSAFMGSYNTDGGVSRHTTPLIEWLRSQGYGARVFTHYRKSSHGKDFKDKIDEDFITRCYTTEGREGITGQDGKLLEPFKKEALLTAAKRGEFNVLVLEDWGMLPYKLLPPILSELKELGIRIVLLNHDNKPKPKEHAVWKCAPYLDAVINWLPGQMSHFKGHVPEEKIFLTDFPCYPTLKINKNEARASLGLPKDKKIIITFGEYDFVAPFKALYELRENNPAIYLVAFVYTEEGKKSLERTLRDLGYDRGYDEIRLDPTLQGWEKRAKYVTAADIVMLDKGKAGGEGEILSSTAYQVIDWALIIARDNRFFKPFNNGEVLKYRNDEELKEHIKLMLTNHKAREEVLASAKEFAHAHSPERVSTQLINIFNLLLQPSIYPSRGKLKRILNRPLFEARPDVAVFVNVFGRWNWFGNSKLNQAKSRIEEGDRQLPQVELESFKTSSSGNKYLHNDSIEAEFYEHFWLGIGKGFLNSPLKFKFLPKECEKDDVRNRDKRDIVVMRIFDQQDKMIHEQFLDLGETYVLAREGEEGIKEDLHWIIIKHSNISGKKHCSIRITKKAGAYELEVTDYSTNGTHVGLDLEYNPLLEAFESKKESTESVPPVLEDKKQLTEKSTIGKKKKQVVVDKDELEKFRRETIRRAHLDRLTLLFATLVSLLCLTIVPLPVFIVSFLAAMVFSVAVHEIGHWIPIRIFDLDNEFNTGIKGIYFKIAVDNDARFRTVVGAGMGASGIMGLTFAILSYFYPIPFFVLTSLISSVFAASYKDRKELAKKINFEDAAKRVFSRIRWTIRLTSKQKRPFRIIVAGEPAAGKGEFSRRLKTELEEQTGRTTKILSGDDWLLPKNRRNREYAYPYNKYEIKKLIQALERTTHAGDVHILRPIYINTIDKRLGLYRGDQCKRLRLRRGSSKKESGYEILPLCDILEQSTDALKDSPINDFLPPGYLSNMMKRIKTHKIWEAGSKENDVTHYRESLGNRPLKKFLADTESELYVDTETGDIFEGLVIGSDDILILEFEQALRFEELRKLADVKILVSASSIIRESNFKARRELGLRYADRSEEEADKKWRNFEERLKQDEGFQKSKKYADIIVTNNTHLEGVISDMRERTRAVKREYSEEVRKAKVAKEVASILSEQNSGRANSIKKQPIMIPPSASPATPKISIYSKIETAA